MHTYQQSSTFSNIVTELTAVGMTKQDRSQDQGNGFQDPLWVPNRIAVLVSNNIGIEPKQIVLCTLIYTL